MKTLSEFISRTVNAVVWACGGGLGLSLFVNSLLDVTVVHACQTSIVPAPPLTAIYDPFSGASLTIETAVQLKTVGVTGCGFAIAVQNSPSVSAAAPSSMHFQILDLSGAVILDSSQLQTPTPILGQAAPTTMNPSIPFIIKIPQGQIVAPGSYSMPIVLTPVFASDAQRAPAGSPVTVSLLLTVAPSLSVNVAGGGQATTLDFGVLTPGATRAVSLHARSNQRFALIATSDNGGVLRLNAAMNGEDWQVPYTIRLGAGIGVALPRGQTAKLIQQPTSLNGAVVPLEVTIGDPTRQRAGLYKDVITVQVAAEP